jgi:hypothetical protein
MAFSKIMAFSKTMAFFKTMAFSFYVFSFTMLYGLGVCFWNAESLLAVCFFVWFSLCLLNSEKFKISQSLQLKTAAVHTALLNGYIGSVKHSLVVRKEKLEKEEQLLACINTLIPDEPNKSNRESNNQSNNQSS